MAGKKGTAARVAAKMKRKGMAPAAAAKFGKRAASTAVQRKKRR